jgi:hypothetical protein
MSLSNLLLASRPSLIVSEHYVVPYQYPFLIIMSCSAVLLKSRMPALVATQGGGIIMVCVCVVVVVVVNRFWPGKTGLSISPKYDVGRCIPRRTSIIKSSSPTISGDPSSCQTDPNRNIKHIWVRLPQNPQFCSACEKYNRQL